MMTNVCTPIFLFYVEVITKFGKGEYGRKRKTDTHLYAKPLGQDYRLTHISALDFMKLIWKLRGNSNQHIRVSRRVSTVLGRKPR